MLIEFSNVGKKFGSKLVLEDVNFKINNSSINILMGPNGAGKSTIAKLLIGLEKPTKGFINFKKKLKIAYLPQGYKNKNEIPMRARDYAYCNNILFEDLVGNVYQTKSELEKIWDISLSDMSGGELQTFLLSTSFAKNPELLILDEPTTYLDIDLENRFYEILEYQRKVRNMSIFIISHDLRTVLKNADQILCLNKHICCVGNQDNIKDFNDSNVSIYQHFHDHKH